MNIDYDTTVLNLCMKIADASNVSVLEYILMELIDISNATSGKIWLKGPQRRIRCSAGEMPNEYDNIDFDIDIISSDAESDPRLFKSRAKKIESEPILNRKKGKTWKRGLVVRPIHLFSSENIIGQLILYFERHKPFENTTSSFEILYNLLSLYLGSQNSISHDVSGNIRRANSNVSIVKDTLLATISHEIRTPLNGMVGMISLLQDTNPLTVKQKEYITTLMECSHHLMTLMNNMLDFSRIASGNFVLNMEEMNISKIAQDSVRMIEGKAKTKGLELKIEITKDIPILRGDSQRLTQVLSNLLSNAVKFTDKGYISLSIKAEQLLSTKNYAKKWKLSFNVEDTGIGIINEEKRKIFEAFYQSSPGNISEIGSGLGLSISRELVKMMGGDIFVLSEGVPGLGSSFKFSIVFDEELQITSLGDDYVKLLSGAKILVVDDTSAYRIQLTNILLKWGCNPVVVSSAKEALQYLNHKIKFNVIIIDICMPLIDGIELAQQIKMIPDFSRIPLIALSSIVLDKEPNLFDVFLYKPIDENKLFPLFVKCLTNFQEKNRRTKAKIKILIVEDDQTSSFTIKEYLIHMGYSPRRIKIVENGRECINEVKVRKYDVIFMDIVMPILGGIETIKELHKLDTKPIIIVISASVQDSDKQKYQQVGIDGYLPKPILQENLKSLLDSVL